MFLLTVKPNDCLVREWVHEAEYLPSPSNKDLTLLACQPGTIAAVRRRFGGIAAVPGGQDLVFALDNTFSGVGAELDIHSGRGGVPATPSLGTPHGGGRNISYEW